MTVGCARGQTHCALPPSAPHLPTFVNDVGQTFGTFVNEESQAYAMGTGGKYPLISGEGGKEPLEADLAEFTMGSDHELYAESSYGIPAIATMLERRAVLTPADAPALTRTYLATEHAAFESIASFAIIPDSVRGSASDFFRRLETITGTAAAPAAASGDAAIVFARNADVKGPMVVFGYDYLEDHSHGRAAPHLLAFQGARGVGEEFAYEVLNLVDGNRSARDIRDEVSAEYGPVDVKLVSEYLRALEGAGVVRATR